MDEPVDLASLADTRAVQRARSAAFLLAAADRMAERGEDTGAIDAVKARAARATERSAEAAAIAELARVDEPAAFEAAAKMMAAEAAENAPKVEGLQITEPVTPPPATTAVPPTSPMLLTPSLWQSLLKDAARAGDGNAILALFEIRVNARLAADWAAGKFGRPLYRGEPDELVR